MRAFIQLPWAAPLLRRRVSVVFSLGLLVGLLGLGLGPRALAAQTVYPKGDLVSPQPQPNGSGTATFQVTNQGSTSARYSLAASGTGAVTSATLVGPSLLRVNAGATANVTVNYTTGSSGDGQVLLEASDDGAGTWDQGSITVSLPKAQPQWTQDHTTWYTGQNVSTNYPWFHLRNQGDTPMQFGLSVSCSGNISNCAVNSPAPSLSPGSSTDITVSYTTGPASSGSGTIQLTATSSLGSPATTSLTIVPLSEAVQVTPKGGTAALSVNGTTSVPFTVRETGNNGSGFNYTLTASCSGVIVSCTFPSTGTTTMTLGPAPNVDQPVSLTLRGTSDYAGGPGTVSLTASYTNPWGQTSQDWGSYSTTIADERSYTVSVTSPAGSTAYTAENVSTNYVFTVTNTGNTTALYNLSVPTCTGTQSGCTFLSSTGPTTTTVTVAPNGGSVSVPVYYTSRAAGQNAMLALRATYGGVTGTSPTVTIVPLSESVAVSASTVPPAPAPGTSATYGFTVSATGNNTSPITYTLSASCSGALSCSATPSPASVTITPGSPASVSVPVTATSSLAGGAGSVTLTASYTNSWGQVYSGTATTPVTVPDVRTYHVQVSPKNGATTYSEAVVATNTIFTITNNGNSRATYAVTQPRPCTGQASGTSCTVRAGYTSVTVDPGQSTNVPVDLTTGPGNQVLQVYLRAEATANAAFADTGSVRVVPIDPSVRVEALGDTTVATGTSGAARFRVTNVGTGYYTTYRFQVTSCAAPLATCSLSADSLWVPPDTATVVTVNFTAGGSAGSSPVTLRAYVPNTVNPYESSATNTVTIFDANSVAIMSVDPGLLQNRDLCLTISAGEGAAYECGDLRLVHALPTTRTMNRAHTPVLLYNSQQAAPHPIAVADVRLPSTSTPSDLVTATLKGTGGQTLATAQWPAWTGGTVKRIAIGFDASTYPTGRYPYTLTVSTIHNDVPTTQSASGAFLVVNRSNTAVGNAPFGAGWWVAGLEQLPMTHPDTLLWVGGDGSARVYARAAGSDPSIPFRAHEVDRPDSITFDGTFYTRWAEHRLQVRFDANGRHVQTINRLGHVTGFGYTGSGAPGSITLPPSAAGLQYVFSYQGGVFTGVSAPGARSVGVVVTGGLLRSITDPDTTTVQFAYTGSDPRIRTRTDRLLHPTSYDYDAASRLSTESIAMTGTAPIVTTFRAAEGMPILNGPSDSADVYTRVIGPRGDTTTTKFWLNRFGQVNVVEDALQHRTTVVRDSRWPALAGRVTEPNGHYVTALYDDHGNLKERTDHNPLGDGQDATTGYTWDLKWDFVTSETLPEQEVTLFGYDPGTGNRTYQQLGHSVTRRTTFAYDPQSNLLVSTTAPDTPPDSVAYDNLGNVQGVMTPKGYWTTYVRDNLGRVETMYTPIDSADRTRYGTANRQVKRTVYDLADRELKHTLEGPQWAGVSAQTVTDSTRYDKNGQPLEVWRWSTPDPAGIGMLHTMARYDAAGRKVADVAVDGQVDSVRYDPAGNVTDRITRRGDHIVMYYNALNQLVTRLVPSVHYDPTRVGLANFEMPVPYGAAQYPAFGGGADGSLDIPQDSAAFEYDSGGRLRVANNGDAQVERTFFPDGKLQSETQRIRDYNGPSFDHHVYTLQYTYDRNGRRKTLQHPNQLAPSPGQSLVNYAYDPETGDLATVTDVLNHVFSFDYSARGERKSQTIDAGASEAWTYDDDGNLSTHTTNGVAGRLRNAAFLYDGRGKQLWRGDAASGDTLQSTYSGLGYAVATSNKVMGRAVLGGALVTGASSESSSLDALGNILSGSSSVDVSGPGYVNRSSTGRAVRYELGTGRNRAADRDGGAVTDTVMYDAAGNVTMSTFSTFYSGMSGANVADRASYYAADGKVAVVDYRSATIQNGFSISQSTLAYDEYRYDALGRRVFVRSRRTCSGGGNFTECHRAFVRRTVWDGDAELYEIQTPGGLYDGGYFENDTQVVHLTPNPLNAEMGNGDPNPYYGRVAYTYGLTIDQPIGLVRMNYADTYTNGAGQSQYVDYPAFTMVPLWNAQGRADNGVFVDGTQTLCQTTSVPGTHCVAWSIPMGYFAFSRTPFTPAAWHGSLLDDKRDKTGTLYRRNRYYDPSTGRFTQEDPLGLAGGLNVYGFANGDPVNYSDPFGTCPEWLDRVPCQVTFDALTVSASWLTWSGSLSIGEFAGQGQAGTYWSHSTGGGAGTVPSPANAAKSLKPTGKSWLPSLSVTVTKGGSQSLDSFFGESDEVGGSASAVIWTASGSLSSNPYGKGYSVGAGVGTPGLPVAGAGQGSTTKPLTRRQLRETRPADRAPADATAVHLP